MNLCTPNLYNLCRPQIAAAAAGSLQRPASFACHYLRVAQVGPVDIRVESLRQTRRAESLKVTLVQDDAPILEALVWTVADLAGIDHDAAASPAVPGPEELEPWEAHLPGGEPPFLFWHNFEPDTSLLSRTIVCLPR